MPDDGQSFGPKPLARGARCVFPRTIHSFYLHRHHNETVAVPRVGLLLGRSVLKSPRPPLYDEPAPHGPSGGAIWGGRVAARDLRCARRARSHRATGEGGAPIRSSSFREPRGVRAYRARPRARKAALSLTRSRGADVSRRTLRRERLLEVGDEVVDLLHADGDAHEVLGKVAARADLPQSADTPTRRGVTRVRVCVVSRRAVSASVGDRLGRPPLRDRRAQRALSDTCISIATNNPRLT